ncbi:MAG: VOC family protein [Acidobacteriota bacterium]
MRWLILPVSVLTAAAVFLSGQTAAPNPTGISVGHIHVMVADPTAMEKLLTDVLGGSQAKAGPLNMVKLPGVFFIVGGLGGGAKGGEPTPRLGTKGSSVDHVGFSVKSYADTTAKAKAANLPVQELTAGVQGFITFPGDIIVEIQEDTALTTPSAFSHYHLTAPDQNVAREWYIKTFGGTESERRKGLKGAGIPPGSVDFLGVGGAGKGKGGPAPAAAPAPLAGTKGRSLDHIGFEVKDLKAFTDGLVAGGTKMDMAFNDMSTKLGLKIAFITDPNGTYIELTEGLNSK